MLKSASNTHIHSMIKLSIFFLLLISSLLSAATRVACVGDSTTFGSGIGARASQSYPAQLQKLLGNKYEIRNFGVSGATMLKAGDIPYVAQPAFPQSLEFSPDIVVIMLGANDSKAINWDKNKAAFLMDTMHMIRTYQQLSSAPRIILCTPLPAYKGSQGEDPFGIRGEIIANEQVPILLKVAEQTGVECIHMHQDFALEGALKGNQRHVDAVHPNASGAGMIAQRIAYQVNHTADVSYAVAEKLKGLGVAYTVGDFHSYRQYSFLLPKTDVRCVIVAPHTSLTQKPWIWRASHFGDAPALDLALLDRGYHLVYCDTEGLFGASLAMRRWDYTYALTQTLGLGAKPIIEGMSYGGLTAFNWAKQNPDKVTAIYGDNPVCDIRAWPAIRNTPAWQLCLDAYAIKEDDLKGFTGNPIDGLDALAKAQVPIMFSIGAKDVVAPAKDHAFALEKAYRKAGGKFVQLWIDQNAGHEPHLTCPLRELLTYTLAASQLNQKKAVILGE